MLCGSVSQVGLAETVEELSHCGSGTGTSLSLSLSLSLLVGVGFFSICSKRFIFEFSLMVFAGSGACVVCCFEMVHMWM